jgi:hypothetical protein
MKSQNTLKLAVFIMKQVEQFLMILVVMAMMELSLTLTGVMVTFVLMVKTARWRFHTARYLVI